MASGPSAVVIAPAPAHAARASVATAHERKNRPAMSASLSRDVIVAAERATAVPWRAARLWGFSGRSVVGAQEWLRTFPQAPEIPQGAVAGPSAARLVQQAISRGRSTPKSGKYCPPSG